MDVRRADTEKRRAQRGRRTWQGRALEPKFLGLAGLLIIGVEKEKDWREPRNQDTGSM